MNTKDDLLEYAWGIIANAGGGDWERESKVWQGAAARWRTDYFKLLDRQKPKRWLLHWIGVRHA